MKIGIIGTGGEDADELLEYFDRNQILGGLCMIFSSIESHGVIHHKGLEPLIIFGELDKSVKERTIQLKNTFEKAGIETTLSEDIEAALWRKFILICLSGLGAIANSGYGLIRETPETRQIIIDVLTEVSLVAKAKTFDKFEARNRLLCIYSTLANIFTRNLQC